ncbi:MAG: hypothetical protein LC808_13360, partial [Actinobacteria bacterium]|nr:hypothetical protein [Actinomycetota bacterium]
MKPSSRSTPTERRPTSPAAVALRARPRSPDAQRAKVTELRSRAVDLVAADRARSVPERAAHV